jgi:hypothetical protein
MVMMKKINFFYDDDEKKKNKKWYFNCVGFGIEEAVVDEVGCNCVLSHAGYGLLQLGDFIYAPFGEVFTRATQNKVKMNVIKCNCFFSPKVFPVLD